MRTILVLLMLWLNITTAYCQAEFIETTFGNNGIVVEHFYGCESEAEWAMVQPEGKILIIGSVNPCSVIGWYLEIIRYNTDGTRDVNFSNDGVAYPSGSWLLSASLGPDGKIVVANYGFYSYIDKFNSDGTADTSFGEQGSLHNFAVASLA